MTITAQDKSVLDNNFTRTTTVWGNITMMAGLAISVYLPIHLVMFSDVDISMGQVIGAYLAVAAAFGVFWIVEPLTYFPILGPAGMYQAFMIGNIANKLLPAAIVAQSAVGAKAGTRKSQFTATAAICGAALVHVTFLLLFVGIFGSWVVSVVPENVTEIAQSYILPSIMGGVVIQLISSSKNVRVTTVALIVSALVVFVLTPLLPGLFGDFQLAVAVILSVIVAWCTRNRPDHTATPADDGELVGIN